VKRPIVPSEFIVEICQDAKDSGIKKTRYTQRLTPVDLTAAANLEGLKRICPIVLKPHFHKEQDQKPMKFAIRPGIRNHNKLNRDEIIKTVAEFVGKDHGHSVDLKNYDKLIIVECFKNSLGMAVLDKFDSLERFNLQQIYEKIEK
jgi:tRNA acetyltransferase TAN1